MERRENEVIKKVRKENLRHISSCRKNLLKTNSKHDLEYKNGYKIYKWCRNYLDNDDYTLHRFWVVKHDKNGYKRGQKNHDQEGTTEILGKWWRN